jgi:hypothetical protein
MITALFFLSHPPGHDIVNGRYLDNQPSMTYGS